jgi:sialic acid synthase SpsE
MSFDTPRKPYMIGEPAYNHEGDLQYILKTTDEIASIPLEAIKFHLLLNIESYLQARHPLVNVIGKWTFSETEWDTILDHAAAKNLDIIAMCDDVESIEYIIRKNKKVAAIEIHATGLNDYFLLDAATKFNGRIVLGISGSTLDEIQYAINFLHDRGKGDLVLMYGFQSYPTDYHDINLSNMQKIQALFGLPVGYADHTGFDDPNNEIISAMAGMMGIAILEKHYTPDFGKERVDYHAAVGIKQMIRIRDLLTLALTVYGKDDLRMTKAELEYGNQGPMKKAVVAKRKIKKGEKLSFDNLWFKRTVEEGYIKQLQFSQLIGLEAKADIEKDEIIDFGKVHYKFLKPSLNDFIHLRSNR